MITATYISQLQHKACRNIDRKYCNLLGETVVFEMHSMQAKNTFYVMNIKNEHVLDAKHFLVQKYVQKYGTGSDERRYNVQYFYL